ncbi:MAG: lipopolysaccharide biosynthesis protein [Rhodospirillales bacterium]|nr:lipopolysaccharide biosynthesis protein [Rhodospirillales bacterium]
MLKRIPYRRLANLGARGMASIADQGATAAISFLASVFIGRKLGAEPLGIYAITNVFVTLIRSLQNSIVLEPMSVYGPRRTKAEHESYFSFLLGLENAWIGGLMLLMMALSALVWAAGRIETDVLYAFWAGAVFAFLSCFQYFLRRQFYIEFRQYLAMVQSLSFLLLVAAGFAVMSRSDGWTLVDVYVLLCVCSIVVCVVQGGRFWHRLTRVGRADIRRYAREHWSYGKWVLLTVPIGLVTYQGYFFFVGSLVSAEAAGHLKAAETLIAPFSQVAMGLSLMIIPMVSRNVDQMPLAEQRAQALRLSIPLFGLATVYAAAVYFGGEYALRALFGERIEDAVDIVKIMAFVPLFLAAPMPASVFLSALQRANMRFYSQSMAATCAMLVGVPLVILYDIRGAALGLLLTQMVFTAGQWSCLFWVWRRQPSPQPT